MLGIAVARGDRRDSRVDTRMRPSQLRIDDASLLPVYEQLREQLGANIASGVYARGEKLPAVRELATRLRINPTTVHRAYAELERQGFVRTRRGLGTFVAGTPKPERKGQNKRLTQRAERFVVESLAVGYAAGDVLSAIQSALERRSGVVGYTT